MKKTIMKWTASIAATAMLSSVSAPVFAATQSVSSTAEVVKEVSCIGTDAYYTIDADGHMVLYGNGEVELREPMDANWTTEEKQLYWEQQDEAYDFIQSNVMDLVISEGITNVVLPSSAGFLFQALETVSLPDTLQEITNHLFANSQLQAVSIPASVTVIQDGAFRNCLSLQSVTFAEDAQLKMIRGFAFFGAPLSDGVQLPAGLEFIEQFAFKNDYAGRLFSLSNQTELDSYCFTTGKDILTFYEETGQQYLYYTQELQPYVPSNICGDVNLDCIVDLRDMILLNKFMTEQIILTSDQLAVSDCNGDGVYSDDDIAALMQFLLFLESSLPISNA